MKRLLCIIIGGFLSYFLTFTLVIWMINLIRFKNINFVTFDYSILFIEGTSRFKTIFFFATGIFFMIIFVTYAPVLKQYIKGDKKSYSTLMTSHQVKKEYMKLKIKNGGILVLTTKDRINIAVNPIKIKINKLLEILNLDVLFRLKVAQKYYIGGEAKYKRAGLIVKVKINPITKTNYVWIDPSKTHNLILGATDSGKSYSLTLPALEVCRIAGESALVFDLKGEIKDATLKKFINDGYKTYVINWIEPEESDGWNPLELGTIEYIKALKKAKELEYQINKKIIAAKKKHSIINPEIPFDFKEYLTKKELAVTKYDKKTKRLKVIPDFSKAQEYFEDVFKTMTYNPNEENNFWNDKAKEVMRGIENLLCEEDVSCSNFEAISKAIFTGTRPFPTNRKSTWLKEYITNFKDNDDLSRELLEEFVNSPSETYGSILSVLKDKLSLVTLNSQITKMMSSNTIDFSKIGDEKTIIYLVVHDEKNTYHSLATLFIKQLYECLIGSARKNKENKELKVPMNVYFDEFANAPVIESIGTMLTASRARGMRFNLYVQDYSQLDNRYGKEISKLIRSQTNTVYLLSKGNETLEEVSKSLGNKQVINKGKEEIKPLVTTDQLKNMKLGEAFYIMRRGNNFKTRLPAYNKYNFFTGDYNECPKKYVFNEYAKWIDISELYKMKRKEYENG